MTIVEYVWVSIVLPAVIVWGVGMVIGTWVIHMSLVKRMEKFNNRLRNVEETIARLEERMSSGAGTVIRPTLQVPGRIGEFTAEIFFEKEE